jgi:hypothetical protein
MDYIIKTMINNLLTKIEYSEFSQLIILSVYT